MTITDEQEEDLRLLLSVLDNERARLTRWELTFLDDQMKAYDEFGSEIRLSPKQWSILNRMYEKVTE